MSRPASPATPAAFAPAPRATRRGFTAERQRRFIAALAATGSVSSAAAAIGMSRQAAYLLRAAPGAEAFAAAWDAAIARGVAALKAVAFDRAIHGEPAPIYYGGTQVGETRLHNNQLLMRLLTHYDRQGHDNPDAISPAVAARLAARARPMRDQNAAERRLGQQYDLFRTYENARTGRTIAATIRSWLAEGPEHLDYQLTRLETVARTHPMLAAEADPAIAARADATRAALDGLSKRLTAELVEAFNAAGLIPHYDMPD